MEITLGELARSIGEDGERLIEHFIEMIGWGSPPKDNEILCEKERHLNSSGNPKRTHGIDFVFSEKKSMENFTAQNTLVSVKFSRKGYPANNAAKTDLKSYLEDLSTAMECYKRSDLRQNIAKQFDGEMIERDTIEGVLFWLTNSRESDQDLISKISNSIVSSDLIFSKSSTRKELSGFSRLWFHQVARLGGADHALD